MRRAPAETMLFADLHALHVDLDAVERDARVLLARERDLVEEVLMMLLWQHARSLIARA